MASKSINNYRLYCNTESLYINTWNSDTPTKCPNNNTHQIDTNSISIIDTINSSTVSIIQGNSSLNGYYRVENIVFTALANQIFTKTFSFPYNVGILTVNWSTGDTHAGDILNCYIAKNTTIGYITQKIQQGDTILHVSPTVFTHLCKGFLINITNGTQNINMGECIMLDPITNTITCSIAANSNMNIGNLLQMTIHNIRNQYLIANENINLGIKHLNTSYLPANTFITCEYINNSNTDKLFKIWYDLIY
jgi:hypothetical protein